MVTIKNFIDEMPKFTLEIQVNAKRASLVAQLVKNPSTMQGTRVQLLGQEDPLETG